MIHFRDLRCCLHLDGDCRPISVERGCIVEHFTAEQKAAYLMLMRQRMAEREINHR